MSLKENLGVLSTTSTTKVKTPLISSLSVENDTNAHCLKATIAAPKDQDPAWNRNNHLIMGMETSQNNGRIPIEWTYKPNYSTRDELLKDRKFKNLQEIKKNMQTRGSSTQNKTSMKSNSLVALCMPHDEDPTILRKTLSELKANQKLDKLQHCQFRVDEQLHCSNFRMSPTRQVSNANSFNWGNNSTETTGKSDSSQTPIQPTKIPSYQQVNPESNKKHQSRTAMMQNRKSEFFLEASKSIANPKSSEFSPPRFAKISNQGESPQPWWSHQNNYNPNPLDIIQNSIRLSHNRKQREEEMIEQARSHPKHFDKSKDKTKDYVENIARAPFAGSFQSPQKDQHRYASKRWTDLIINFRDPVSKDTRNRDLNSSLQLDDPKFNKPLYSSFTADHIFHPERIAGLKKHNEKSLSSPHAIDKSPATTKKLMEQALHLRSLSNKMDQVGFNDDVHPDSHTNQKKGEINNNPEFLSHALSSSIPLDHSSLSLHTKNPSPSLTSNSKSEFHHNPRHVVMDPKDIDFVRQGGGLGSIKQNGIQLCLTEAESSYCSKLVNMGFIDGY